MDYTVESQKQITELQKEIKTATEVQDINFEQVAPLQEKAYSSEFMEGQLSNQEKFRKNFVKKFGKTGSFRVVKHPADYAPTEILGNEVKFTYLTRKLARKPEAGLINSWGNSFKRFDPVHEVLEERTDEEKEEYDREQEEIKQERERQRQENPEAHQEEEQQKTEEELAKERNYKTVSVHKYGFKVNGETTKTTRAMMISTRRYVLVEAEKNKIANKIFTDAKEAIDKDEAKKKLIGKYLDVALALAPPIETIPSDKEGPLSKPQFKPESVEAFTLFVKQLVEDPAETIKNAVTDTLHSVIDFPDKLMGSEAVSTCFDRVMQLRNRYDAINKLRDVSFVPGEEPKDADAVQKLMTEISPKTDTKARRKKQVEEGAAFKDERKDLNLHDERYNFRFISLMSRAMDADMNACLKNAGMSFNEDLISKRGRQIDSDGNLSKRAMEAFRRSQRRRTAEQVEKAKEERTEYWTNRENVVLDVVRKKEEKADNEGNADQQNQEEQQREGVNKRKDTYSIMRTFKELREKADRNTEYGYNKVLANSIDEHALKLTNALDDLDQKMHLQREALKLDSVKASPALVSQIKLSISKNAYKRNVLLERARGYINALNHVLNGTRLNALGSQILKDVQGDKGEDEWTVIDTRLFNASRFKKVDPKRLNTIAEDSALEKATKEEVLTVLAPELAGQKISDRTIAETLKRAILEQVEESDRLINELRHAPKSRGERLIEDLINFRKKNLALRRLYAMKHKDDSTYLKSLIGNLSEKDQENFYKIYGNNMLKGEFITHYIERYRDNKIIQMIKGGDDLKGIYITDQEKKDAARLMTSGVAYGMSRTFEKQRGLHSHLLDILNKEIAKNEKDLLANVAGADNAQIEDNELKDIDTPFDELLETVDLDIFDDEETVEVPTLEAIEERHRAERERRENGEREGEEHREREERERLEREERERREREEEEERQRREREEREEGERREREEQERREREERERQEREERDRENNDGFVVDEDYRSDDEKLWKKAVIKNIINMRSMKPETDYVKKFGRIEGNDEKSIFIRHLLKSYQTGLTDNMRRAVRTRLAQTLNKQPNKVTKKEIDDNMPKELPKHAEVEGFYYDAYFKALDEGKTREELDNVHSEYLASLTADNSLAMNAMVEAWKKAEESSAMEIKLRAEQPAQLQNIEEHKYNEEGYDVDQHGDNSCWACTGTYIANHYLDRTEPGRTAKLSKTENFMQKEHLILSKDTKEYLEQINDANMNRTVNEAVGLMEQTMEGTKMGNPYVMADVFLKNLSNTAVKNTVLIFSNINPMIHDKASKKLLENQLLIKIAQELKEAKGPISMLKPGHYFTVIGVENGKIICRSSTNDPLTGDIEITPAEILDWGRVEFTSLHQLDEETKQSISTDYDTGGEGDLYDQEGVLTKQRPFGDENEKGAYLADHDNIFHNLGVEFDIKEDKKDPLTAMFGKERFYLPKNLDRNKNIADNLPNN